MSQRLRNNSSSNTFPYCGAKNTPKNRKVGSGQQCTNTGQIRRYGTFKISEKMKTSNKEQVPKTPIKIVSSRQDKPNKTLKPRPTKKKKPIDKTILDEETIQKFLDKIPASTNNKTKFPVDRESIPTEKKSTTEKVIKTIPKETNKVIDNIEKLNETSDEKEKRKDILKTDSQLYKWVAGREAKDHYIVGNDFLLKVLATHRWQKYKKLTNNDIVRSFKFLFSDFLQIKAQSRYDKMVYPDWGRFITLKRGGPIGIRDKLLINEYVYDHLTELRKKYPQPDGHISEPANIDLDLAIDDIKKLKARRK